VKVPDAGERPNLNNSCAFADSAVFSTLQLMEGRSARWRFTRRNFTFNTASFALQPRIFALKYLT
jgi:hypothetical protein